MYLVSYISESIWWMGSGCNVSTDISDQLHITKFNEAYQSTNDVNDIQLLLKRNDQFTGLGNMKKLSYLAIQGWSDIASTKVINLDSATHKWQNSFRACLLNLQHFLEKPVFHHVSQQIHHFSELHVCGLFRTINSLLLRDASVDSAIPIFWQLFCTQIDKDRRYEVHGLVFGYLQNALLDSLFT